MSNLFNLGRMGLNVAQAGLNTTGHNIANANTVGYTRQQVLVSTAGGQGSASGYFGKGVQADTVRRIHDSFLANQVNASATVGASLATYADQIGRINNLLADRTVGVAPALTNFFSGLNAVASAPADPAGRQELIGRANSLVTQLNSAQQFFNEQQRNVNEQLATTATQINSYAERIRELNVRIVEANAVSAGAHTPNDLLDQREQLVAELNDLVRVTVIPDGDAINLSIGNGQILLAGERVFPLTTVQSAADPERLAMAYTMPNGRKVELADSAIDGGSLGGLLQYRREALDVVQNELGRVAVGLGMAINQQHVQGRDAAGNQAVTVSGRVGFGSVTGAVENVGRFEGAAEQYRVSYDAVSNVAGGSFDYILPRIDNGAEFSAGAGQYQVAYESGSSSFTVRVWDEATTDWVDLDAADVTVSTDGLGRHLVAFAGVSINLGETLPTADASFELDTRKDAWTVEAYDAATSSWVALDPAAFELTITGNQQAISFAGMRLELGSTLPGGTGQFDITTRQMPFFSVGSPRVVPASEASPVLRVRYADANQLTLDDYQVSFDGTDFTVTRHPGGQAVTLDADAPAGTLRFDGLEIELPTGLTGEHSWLVQPTRQAARDIGLAIERPDQIAAAGIGGGSANNDNALAMAALQTKNTLANGSMSITGGYSQLVNNIGVKTQSVQSASKAQDTLTQQSFAAHQAVSGVNLNEEYINLDFHIQHYNASARLVEVATNLFDTLLGLRT